MISNKDIAYIFDILSLQTTDKFRSLNFKKASKIIRQLPYELYDSDISDIDVPGIGKGIKRRIKEIIDTGSLAELDKEYIKKAQIVLELTKIQGIGYKTAEKYMNLGVTSISDLDRRYRKGELKLTRVNEVGLKYFDDLQKTIPRKEIASYEKFFQKIAKKLFRDDVLITITGSYRRRKSYSHDIDVLITSKSGKKGVMDEFIMYLKRKAILVDDFSYGKKKIYGDFGEATRWLPPH